MTLAVRDLATSLKFYRDGLGLPGKIIYNRAMPVERVRPAANPAKR